MVKHVQSSSIHDNTIMQIDKYERRAKHNLSNSTLKSRLSALRSYDSFIEGEEATPDNFEEWVDNMIMMYEDGKIKASTLREYAKAGRYYFRVVLGDSDSIEHVFDYLPKNDSDPGDYLTDEEWDRMLSSIHNIRYKTIFKIMYKYARRPTEITLLNLNDIDFDEGTIRFVILKKDDKPGRQLPRLEVGGETYKAFRATFKLLDDVESDIRYYLNYRNPQTETIVFDGDEMDVEPLFTTGHGRISYSSVYRKAKQAMKDAGIDKNVTPKTMRHSRATHLDWNGNAPGNIASDMLVHAPDSRVVGRYIHDRSEDEVRDVMDISDTEEE